MRTKLGAFCDKVVEAGWLLALVIVPLFFNVYSSRVFEPDKLGLLRSIATLMALASLVKWAEEAFTGSSQHDAAESPLRAILRVPLILPALLMVAVYLVSTLTSVVPRVSFWGSYQRLQGTYTALSYMVIFFALVTHLRRPEQLQRLWLTVILTSYPIALYGLVQHYQLDPLPWGGDVTFRVAANMGNAIFIGAYLIMVIPLTLARVIHLQTEALAGEARKARLGFAVLFGLVLLGQIWAWAALGFGRGLVAALLTLAMLALVAALYRKPVWRFLLLGVYGMVLSVQVVCLFFSQSRGPLLGFVGGLFFFVLLYLFARNWRRAALALVTASAVLLCLLVIVNLPDSPLAAARDIPYVGRLGRVFEIESGTGKVRALIWEGVVDMLAADPVRTFIGYGPEAMYVAYNPFYPPDLAHYEARNASPDRSHNETFDALVMTGILGFGVYMLLFGSIFYFGLRWLGLLRTRGQTWLFAVLAVSGALLGLLVPLLIDRSLRFSGVGLPVGLVAGLTLYVATSALTRNPAAATDVDAEGGAPLSGWRQVLLMGLFAAIVAHFIEIHFGIAIAATRTYFWAYAAVLVVLGQNWVAAPQIARALEDGEAKRTARASRRDRRRSQGARGSAQAAPTPAPVREGLYTQIEALGCVAAMIMMTLFWNYTTNPTGQGNAIAILTSSFATLAARGGAETTSLGLAALLASTGLIAGVAAVAELALRMDDPEDDLWWLVAAGRFVVALGGPALLFAIIHAAGLGPGTHVTDLIYRYYVAVLLLWLALSLLLHLRGPNPSRWVRGALAALYPVALVVCLVVIENANIGIVKADSLYKQGLRYERQGAWDEASTFYRQAIDMAPTEDYYYLFSGRALMERGKTDERPQVREAYFAEAEKALKKAQALNALNTDHTANLGRLYRTWAEYESDPALRQQKLERARDYYAEALVLSPNNAQIHNEAGLVHYLLGDDERALDEYRRSLALDEQFMQTYVLLGDIFLAQEEWAQAAEAYEKAVAQEPGMVQGWSALGYAYSRMQAWDRAVDANEKVLEIVGQDYSTLKNMAIIHQESGNLSQALFYAEQALTLAPDAERASVERFIATVSAELVKQGR